LPSVRCAGRDQTSTRAAGTAIASAWSIRPRWSSGTSIVPPATGRLDAVAPQCGLAPGHDRAEK
jgi:hypothetical protein